MKKFMLVLAVLVVFGVSSLSAFELGAGLTYGFDAKEIGLTLGAVFPVAAKFAVAPDFTYYFAGSGVTMLEFNANAHYSFVAAGAVKVYALAGLQIAHSSFDSGWFGSVSSTDIGLNLGAGIEYSIGKLALFAESKFTISGFEQLALTGGCRMKL